MPCEAKNADSTAASPVMRPSLLPATKRWCSADDTMPSRVRSVVTSHRASPNTRTGGVPSSCGTARS